jgi:hypothetical protein
MGTSGYACYSGNARSLRRSLRGAEAPLFHGCAGGCGWIAPRGLKPHVETIVNRSAEALRHPKALALVR